MAEQVVFLDDVRLERHELFDRLQLAVAAMALVMASVERLRQPAAKDLLLAVLQLAVSLLVIGSVLAWVRTRHAPSAAKIGWLDLLAGAMLLVEWADRYRGDGKVVTPVLCQAVVFLLLGAFQRRIANRRAHSRWVRIDDTGIRVRRSAIRRAALAWDEIAAVDREPEAIRITRWDGSVWRLPLRRYRNGDDAARLVVEAAASRGLAGSGAT